MENIQHFLSTIKTSEVYFRSGVLCRIIQLLCNEISLIKQQSFRKQPIQKFQSDYVHFFQLLTRILLFHDTMK